MNELESGKYYNLITGVYDDAQARILASNLNISLKKACSKMTQATYGDLLEKSEVIETNFKKPVSDTNKPYINKCIKELQVHIKSTQKHIKEKIDNLKI